MEILSIARVSAPHLFNADLDPAFHFNKDPDPAVHINANPDPAPHQGDPNLRPLASILSVHAFILSIHGPPPLLF